MSQTEEWIDVPKDKWVIPKSMDSSTEEWTDVPRDKWVTPKSMESSTEEWVDVPKDKWVTPRSMESETPEDDWWDVIKKSVQNAPASTKLGAAGVARIAEEQPAEGVKNIIESTATPTGVIDLYKKAGQRSLGQGQLLSSAIPALLDSDSHNMEEDARKKLAANPINVHQGSAKSYVSGAATAVAQNAVPLLASIVTRNPGFVLGSAGLQGLGSSYLEQREAGKTPSEALLPAIGSGAAEVAFGELPIGVLMKPGGGLFTRALKSVGTEMGEEALTEFVQAGIEKGTIKPDMTWGEIVSRAEDAGIIGGIAGGATGAAAHGVHGLLGNNKRARIEEQNKIDNAADEGAPTERGTLEGFLRAAEGVPDEGVNITPQAPDNVQDIASMERSPQTGAGAPTENITEDLKAIQNPPQSTEHEQVASRLDELQQQLTQLKNNQYDAVSKLVELNDALNSPATADINIKQKLQEAVDHYRTILSDSNTAIRSIPLGQRPLVLSPKADTDTAYDTLSMVKGRDYQNVDPVLVNDLMDNGHLNVNKDGNLYVTKDGNTLIRDLRNVRQSPEAATAIEKSSPNSSLLEYIANTGGINDTGGDFKAMDAQLWHHGKPFQKKLISENGRNQDDVAGAAWEAGYFPEHAERPSINDLQNAVSRELAGKKRYIGNDIEANADIDIDEMHNWYHNRAKELGVKTIPENTDDLINAVHAKEMEQADKRYANELADQHEMAIHDEYADFDIPFEVIHDENATKPSQTRANEENARSQRPLRTEENPTRENDKGAGESNRTPEKERQESSEHNEKDSGHSRKAQYSVTPNEKFTAKEKQIKSRITSIIRKINPQVKVQLVDKMFGEGAALKDSGASSTERQEVAGAYDKLNNVIYASLNTEKWSPTDTAYHEAFHSIFDMLPANDKAILQKAFPATDKLSHEEHVAIEFARFMTDKNASGFSAAVRRIFSAIRQALRDIGRMFKAQGFNSVEDVFNRAERGDVFSEHAHGKVAEAIRNIDIAKLNDISISAEVSLEQMQKIVKEISPELHDIVYSKKPVTESDRLAMGDIVAEATGNPSDALYSVTDRVSALKRSKNIKLDKEKIIGTVINATKPFVPKSVTEKAFKNLEENLRNTRDESEKSSGKINGFDLAARLLVQSSDGVLRFVGRKYNSKAVDTVADDFYHDAGSDKVVKATYYESIDNYVKPAMNRVAKAVEGLNDKQLTQIVDILQNPDEKFDFTPKVKSASVEIAKIIKENRKYLTDAGLEVGEVKGYFPRVYDTEKIVTDPEAFVEAATRAYKATYPELSDEESLEKAEQWQYNILQQDQMGTIDSKNDFQMFGGSTPPVPNHLKERVLSKEADGILKDFLVRNPVDVIPPFLMRSARKAEFHRRYNPERWTALKKQMRSEGVDAEGLRQVMNAIISNTGMIERPRGKVADALGALRSWSNVVFLSRVAFTSLHEGFTVAVRTGNPKDGLRNMAEGWMASLETKGTQAMRDRAEMYGLVGEIADSMIIAQRTGGDFDSKKRNFKSNRYYRAIGHSQITAGQMAATTKSAQFAIGKWAENIVGKSKYTKSSSFMLNELGIPKDKTQEFAKWVNDNGGKNLADEFGLGDSDMAKLYRTGLRRFVQDVIQVPTPAMRQRYAMTPFGQFAYGLSSYIYAFSKNVLIRNGRMLNRAAYGLPNFGLAAAKATGNLARLNVKGAKANISDAIQGTKENIAAGYTAQDRAAFAMQTMMIIPLMLLAGAVGELRDFIFQKSGLKEKDAVDHLILALSRGGAWGAFDPLVNMFTGLKYQRDPLTTFSGPLPAATAKGVKAIGNYFLNNSENTNNNERTIVEQLYSLGVAPLLTSMIATNSPWILPAYGAIQVINAPQVREAITTGIAGERED